MADGFADDCSKHLGAVGAFHGIAWLRGGDEQVAGLDGAVFGADLGGHCHAALKSRNDARLFSIIVRDLTAQSLH